MIGLPSVPPQLDQCDAYRPTIASFIQMLIQQQRRLLSPLRHTLSPRL